MDASSGVKQLGEGLWAVEGETKLLPGFYFPLRCTIVRQSDGGLLLYSPIHFSDETAAEIRSLGEVRTLFAPNLYHNSFLASAREQFPGAEIVGPLGLSQRKKKLGVSHEVGPDDPRALGKDFEAVFVGGAPKFNEILLHHKASGMLLVGDYFFNIHEARGFLTGFILKNVSKAYGEPKMSTLWPKATIDRTRMRHTAERLLALDVSRICVCHGEIIDEGSAIIRREVDWLFQD